MQNRNARDDKKARDNKKIKLRSHVTLFWFVEPFTLDIFYEY